jgi:hypothetical protein
MVNMKLELDFQDTKSDELDLILKALYCMDNLNFSDIVESNKLLDYIWKSPEDIVTDYLGKVLQHVREEFSQKMKYAPIDITLTVPVVSALFLSIIWY